MSTHYHSEAWRKAREQEIVDSQANPNKVLTLRFLKDAAGWYAEVPNHTRAQNSMVAGADKLIEHFAHGDNCVTLQFRTVAAPKSSSLGEPIFHLKRIAHDAWGGTYVALGLSVIPLPAWLCNVTETVLGEHPKDIWVYEAINSKVEL